MEELGFKEILIKKKLKKKGIEGKSELSNVTKRKSKERKRQ